ncbi:unnamed protein product [Diplocarpon coronariae]
MLTSSLASQKHRIFASDEDGAATPTPTGRPVSLSGQRAEPSRAAQHSTARGAQHRKRCRCRQFLVRGFCFMLGPPPGAGTGRARTGWKGGGGGDASTRRDTPRRPAQRRRPSPRACSGPSRASSTAAPRAITRGPTSTDADQRQQSSGPDSTTPAISAVCGVRVQA